MFRNFLKKQNTSSTVQFNWIKKFEGLIRVAVIDESNERGYVVVFFEKKNQYSMIAFRVDTGEIDWTKEVKNGGYGAPALIKDLVIFPTKFSNVIAISKYNGQTRWEFESSCRVRSPINVIEDNIYFSSGGTIFRLNDNGTVIRQYERTGAFFYGSVDLHNELIITLGTIENECGESTVNVFAFHTNGDIVYELPLFVGPIISSDTSGIAWQDTLGFVGGDNVVICFDVENGRIVWEAKVEGFAGRQVCTVNQNHVYFTTQSGWIGALNAINGEDAWRIQSKDNALVSPISILGDNLIVLADGHLNLLKSNNGQLIHRIPVGHSPYSMVTLKGSSGLVGGGEPPHNGLLFGFKISHDDQNQEYTCSTTCSNAFIDNNHIDVLITLTNRIKKIESIELDGSIFNVKIPIVGECVNNDSFAFRIQLPLTICPGDYVVMVKIILKSNNYIIRPVLIKIERRKPLPKRSSIKNIPDIIQEQPTFSGAAISSTIKKMYGDCDIQQSSFRQMVDAVREKADYEPHETWRLILRRVLTTKATEMKELPEFQAINSNDS